MDDGLTCLLGAKALEQLLRAEWTLICSVDIDEAHALTPVEAAYKRDFFDAQGALAVEPNSDRRWGIGIEIAQARLLEYDGIP